jgi:hypothetical protein
MARFRLVHHARHDTLFFLLLIQPSNDLPTLSLVVGLGEQFPAAYHEQKLTIYRHCQ